MNLITAILLMFAASLPVAAEQQPAYFVTVDFAVINRVRHEPTTTFDDWGRPRFHVAPETVWVSYWHYCEMRNRVIYRPIRKP